MSDLFKEIIPSILQTKKPVLEDEKDYNAFIVNRALSYHLDCILFANEMNLLSRLDKKLQYEYCLNSIRGYKRKYVPWAKKEKIEDLESVQLYYGLSRAKAKEALTILSDDQIKEIRKNTDKGGVSKHVDNRGHGGSNA